MLCQSKCQIDVLKIHNKICLKSFDYYKFQKEMNIDGFMNIHMYKSIKKNLNDDAFLNYHNII